MPLWSLFLHQAALPPKPPAITAPPPCPTPPQYTYSSWTQTREERQFQGEWVVQYLYYSRTKTDACRGTSSTQSKVEGPFRLYPAVPANRVADVNRPEGTTDGLSGAPLRSSTLPEGGAPGVTGPNPTPTLTKSSFAPTNRLPMPFPFFSGFALLVGVLIASFFLWRRRGKVGPVPERAEEPLEGPAVEPASARTMDSIKPNTAWMPDSAETAWLQAFFGIEENGYGPLTQGAVAQFQKKHGIPVDGKVMVGPKTYRALWEAHKDLVNEHWEKLAIGQSTPELDRVMDSPMPPDLRAEMEKLNDDYAAYWAAVEGRYQAILQRNSSLVTVYEERMEILESLGVKANVPSVLANKYQPLIDALYQQAEKVKKDANDGEYAKLLAMLTAADQGKWDEIASAHSTWGGRWGALWSADKSERQLGDQVTSSLLPYAAPAHDGEPRLREEAQVGTNATVAVGGSRTPATTVTPATPKTESNTTAPTYGDVDALVAKYFPKASDQLVIKHTMSEESPGKFGANWGGVVYRERKSGQLICDRQWINFGLISFAYPSGAAVGVLKTLFDNPEEEKAFRSIAERLLHDNDGGEVPEGWRHLLNDPKDYTIAKKSKQDLIDEFVKAMKSGNGQANQDWVFKYLNKPTKKSGVATGDMRDDWNSVLSEFLSRPASRAEQLSKTRDQFFNAAVETALDPKQFGLTTIRGVGFLFDVTVQSGGPTAAMTAVAATKDYQDASEIKKLEMLRDTFGKGSTEWNRRDSVIKSKVLTDDAYQR